MKRMVLLTIGIFVCVVVLVALACNGGGNHANSSNTADSNSIGKLEASACKETGSGRPGKVKDSIKDKIEDKKGEHGLGWQFEHHNFGFDITDSGDGSLEMIIWGSVGDLHGDNNQNAFDDLVGIVKDFARKSCVKSIVFVAQQPQPGEQASTLAGFRWFACEDGYVACPNGLCYPGSCPVFGIGSSDAKSNANGSSNMNANSGTNTNAKKP